MADLLPTQYEAMQALLESLDSAQWLALCIMIGTDYPHTMAEKKETLVSIAKG